MKTLLSIVLLYFHLPVFSATNPSLETPASPCPVSPSLILAKRVDDSLVSSTSAINLSASSAPRVPVFSEVTFSPIRQGSSTPSSIASSQGERVEPRCFQEASPLQHVEWAQEVLRLASTKFAEFTETLYPAGGTLKEMAEGIKRVRYPDHTEAYLFPDGKKKIVYPDGSSGKKYLNGNMEIKLSDGTRISLRLEDQLLSKKPFKYIQIVFADNTFVVRLPYKQILIEEPDRTITFYSRKGSILKKQLYGPWIETYANGESTTIDWQGNVLSSSKDNITTHYKASDQTWVTTFPDNSTFTRYPNGSNAYTYQDGYFEISKPGQPVLKGEEF